MRRSQNSRGNGHYQRDSNAFKGEKLARGLSWFSIGLGLTELPAPRTMARFIGVERAHTGLIRMYGMREVASGIAMARLSIAS